MLADLKPLQWPLLPNCACPLPSLAIILLNKAPLYLCPNSLFGRGDGRPPYLNWGSVLKSAITLNGCVTALLGARDSQGSADWKGAQRGSAESTPSAPEVTLPRIFSHHPLCVYVSGIQGNVNFLLFGRFFIENRCSSFSSTY